MSKFLSQAAVIEFDNEVKHQYQGKGMLRDCVTLRTNVTGSQYKFVRQGRGIANQKASQADVTPMDIPYTRPTADLENWNAPEYTDIFDQAEVNFDEKQELAATIAMALARREDQLVIDALAAGTYSTTPGVNDPETGFQIDLGTGATGVLNVQTLRRAATTGMTKRGVDSQDRYIAITADGLNQLLATTQITDADYNTVRTLVQGDIDTFMGFKFKTIDTRDEGGLPGDGTTACSAFAWQKKAVGLAIGIDMKTTIDWVAQKTSWLCNGMLKAGATIIENAGVVEIIYDSTQNPDQS